MPKYIDVDENSYVSKEDLENIDGYVTKDDMYRLISRHKPYIGQENAHRMCEAVLHTPSVDIEPVRHGRWIRGVSKGFPKNPTCLWYCSCCGEKIRYNDTLRTYQKSKKPVNEVNPRCRKCGAKMDEDEEKL